MERKRQEFIQRWASLTTERASWISRWREISTYLLPGNGRFFLQDRNKGQDRWNNIYDNTGTQALTTLGAGLMSGATSPARPWFRLETPDPNLNQVQEVKVWLDEVSQAMHKVFQKSNTYRVLHQMYEELGAFGTGAAIILPHADDVIHLYPLTCGEYCIATDASGEVVTIYRQFQMTVSQLVKEFGYENCSMATQSMYSTGASLDQWVTVQHSVEPRYDRDHSKNNAKNMAWGSYYMELGSEDKFLRESGFKQFPGVAPRWAVSGGDVYGRSPAMQALGDIKGLQHKQIRKATALDYQTNPPLAVPATLKDHGLDRLPGGVTYVDPQGHTKPVTSLFEVNLELQYLIQDIQMDQQRINRAFFADLFLMLSNSDDPRMTATEVAARQEEKMLMLGPVLERLSNELYSPLIEITFTHMQEAGILPPPPQQMSGMPLNVVLVSVLAQAQQAIGTNSIDRFMGNVAAIAQYKPEILDKINTDAWADIYSDKMGVPPQLIVSSDAVQKVRDARAKAQAAQQAAALQEQQSKTVQNLGKTPTSGPANAAMDMMNQYSGYGTAVQ